jgi:hypothetical protein
MKTQDIGKVFRRPTPHTASIDRSTEDDKH